MRQPNGRPFRLSSLLLPAVFLACSHAAPAPVLVPAPTPQDVESSLFLIGDSGLPDSADKVLETLTRLATDAPNPTIVFLGDNAYYFGLPDSNALDRKSVEKRLLWQIRTGLNSHTPTYFVPGNHDWQNGRDSGWAAIKRQEAYIAQEGGDVVKMIPSGGCPGPVTVELPGRIRLVALDSQWFIHGGPKPVAICRPNTMDGIVDSLKRTLDVPPGEDAVVVMHHPFRTHGGHGGYFTLEEHLFPLRSLAKWLWIPLPIIGSLYPLSRMNGASDQDLSGSGNQLMRQRLREAFAPRPPRVLAAGHEHTLQVLTDNQAPTQLVSGSGYDGHTEPVAWRDDTRYAAAIAGFMRVDRLKDGRLRLGVLRPTAKGVEELYSEWLPEVRR